MATQRAPKQWSLSKTETINSFENWKQNLVYTLSLDNNFAPFLQDGVTWVKKSRTTPLRGFTNDPERQENRRTALQKVKTLELLLGQIANFCPVISRNTIVKSSTSLYSIWHAIRLHFGFQATGAHFIDFVDFKLEIDERPEDLYQRLMAFTEDNLLKSGGSVRHHGDELDEDEELSPSLENMVVLTWLRLIHPELPKLVKQRYGTELRTNTIASIKPEISQALDSLIDELKSNEEARVMRAPFQRGYKLQKPLSVNRPKRTCPLCSAAGRSDRSHFLSQCKFLPEQDRKFMIRARQITNIIDENDSDQDSILDSNDCDNACSLLSMATHRVQVRQSPYIDVFSNHNSVRVTVDSGAEGNMIQLAAATRLGINIQPSAQSAHQADGVSPMKVVGEIRTSFNRGGKMFKFSGLVVENLDVDILAGIPFMETNDITIRPAKQQVILSDGTTYTYGSSHSSNPKPTIRRACVIASDKATTVWPGEFIELEVPSGYPSDNTFTVEPRTDTRRHNSAITENWPEVDVITSVGGHIRIPNLTSTPQVLKRQEHFCQIRPVFVGSQPTSNNGDTNGIQNTPTVKESRQDSGVSHYASQVVIDPDDILSSQVKQDFSNVLQEFDSVFSPDISGYNGASGPFQAHVNMGPVLPPQRKGRIPQYARDKLDELQQKFDSLEQLGVFVKPEDVGVQVEYLNPSFLVRKPNGGHRLVTAFSEVGKYSKPQPSLLPDVDSTLRQIAKWKYLIKTDLSSAFYQIPLAKDSMKYCGVATPYRGIRVYARSAMGMPGSETALEELMCRVFGDLIQEGSVTKLADDLYCGADTPEELLHVWKKVLTVLHTNNLKLSAIKTVVAPKSTTILGWVWEQGTIRASNHRIVTLATCTPPDTVHGLRSFIGAYKVLSRVIPGCSSHLAPLDGAIAGRTAKDKIDWSDPLLQAFQDAQAGLASNRAITLPRPQDQLWIVTDGAVRKPGIGATLYITRENHLHVAGFFSAKMRKLQVAWLPCEIEALAIATATKHFSPYITQSHNKACILTDSRPCVLAYEKLCRGEFSASPRVSTFLSTVSRYQASVKHLAGVANCLSDFASRNPATCESQCCQVYTFIQDVSESVVRHVSIHDIMNGTTRLPFTSRNVWRGLQDDCPDLRRTKAHLLQGTRPSKKATNIKDVKRYLNSVTIAKDGLLVVSKSEPLQLVRDRIVVPRRVIDGLVTSLHVQLDHPSSYQLKQVCHRYLFALDLDKAIETVCSSCHLCASLRKSATCKEEQSTGDPPVTIGTRFAADVLRRERQCILVVRETVTSFTTASIVDNEQGPTLRDALIRLSLAFRPLDGPHAVIRVDSAPGFVSIQQDELLKQNRLSLEIGRVKNINKNPVAERAVQELEGEIVRHSHIRSPITSTVLAIVVARLNSRIRSRGLSSREMWTQRDQFTNEQLPLNDQELITKQHDAKLRNHPYSEVSKSPRGVYSKLATVSVGDLVYLHNDRNKTCARSRYLVTAVEGLWCSIQKFVGSQLRSTSYRVKLSECYKVSPETIPTEAVDHTDDDQFEVPNGFSQEVEMSHDVTSGHTDVELIDPIPDIPVDISEPVSTLDSDTPTHQASSGICTNTGQPAADVTTSSKVQECRPKRQCRLPARFNDFVMDI